MGYVAQASERDLAENQNIKNKHVPGLRVGKIGLEKALEEEINVIKNIIVPAIHFDSRGISHSMKNIWVGSLFNDQP